MSQYRPPHRTQRERDAIRAVMDKGNEGLDADALRKANQGIHSGLQLEIDALLRTVSRTLDADGEFDPVQIALALKIAAEISADLAKMNQLAVKALGRGAISEKEN